MTSVQCVIFGRASFDGEQLLSAGHCFQHHVDRYIAVGVAIDLDARAVHALHPGIECFLRLGDISFVPGSRRVARTPRHRAFRERAVDGVLPGCADAQPLIAESAANARGDHPLQVGIVQLEVHPMQQLAAVADLLERRQISVLVMHARQPVANELLGYMSRAVPATLLLFLRRELRPHADLVEHGKRLVSHTPAQISAGIAIEGPAGRIARIASDACELERLAVIEAGVSAAMSNSHRVILRHPVQVANVQRPLVLHLGVVVEEAADPVARRRLARFGDELVDDAVDRHELDVERIADDHLVEQRLADRMVVTIDEARHDRHALRVEHLSVLAGECTDLCVAADRNEMAAADCEGFGPGESSIDGMDIRVANDQIRFVRCEDRSARSARQCAGSHDPQRRQADEVSSVVAATIHIGNSRVRSPSGRMPQSQ